MMRGLHLPEIYLEFEPTVAAKSQRGWLTLAGGNVAATGSRFVSPTATAGRTGVPGSGSDDGIIVTALSAWLSEGFYGIRVTA